MIVDGKMQYLFDETGRRYLDVSAVVLFPSGAEEVFEGVSMCYTSIGFKQLSAESVSSCCIIYMRPPDTA